MVLSETQLTANDEAPASNATEVAPLQVAIVRATASGATVTIVRPLPVWLNENGENPDEATMAVWLSGSYATPSGPGNPAETEPTTEPELVLNSKISPFPPLPPPVAVPMARALPGIVAGAACIERRF